MLGMKLKQLKQLKKITTLKVNEMALKLFFRRELKRVKTFPS